MSDATCDGEQKVGWHLTCLIVRRSRILQGCECECSAVAARGSARFSLKMSISSPEKKMHYNAK
jgi:hypothetical protein